MDIEQFAYINACHNFYCQKGFGPILLPLASRLQIAEDQKTSGLFQIGELMAACPACWRVSVYSGNDIPPVPSGIVDRGGQHHEDWRALRLARRCGVDGCRSVVTIHAVAPAGTSIRDVKKVAQSRWEFDQKCRCNNRHGAHYLRDAPPDFVPVYVVDGIGLVPHDLDKL